MATIQDVAKLAGVSTATVSHVLNKSRTVLPETRDLVLNAVKQLNYRPSAIARSMSTKRTQLIGVIVADITKPFHGLMVRGIEDLLLEQNYRMIVCNTDEHPEREGIYLEQLLTQRVDGVIVAPTGKAQSSYDEYQRTNTPLVFVDRLPTGQVGPLVAIDDGAAGYTATRYLLALGHRSIGLVFSRGSLSTVQRRLSGFRRAMQEQNILVDESLIQLDNITQEDATRASQWLLTREHPPTAIITGNIVMTLGFLQALQISGKKSPDDVSLVSFDDSPWAPLFTPPLTAIQTDISAVCSTAVSMLLEQIAQTEQNVTDEQPLQLLEELRMKTALINATLIKRSSTKAIQI